MRPWHIWSGFATFLIILILAMGWISKEVLRLDEAEMEARRQAALEENVRLALWRMDSWLAPQVAQESARPYFSYGAFYPVDKAYNKMYGELKYGEVLMPSDLLNQTSPYVKLHFQFDAQGDVTSPQTPRGNERDVAESRALSSWQAIEMNCSVLDDLKGRVPYPELATALREQPPVEPASLPDPQILLAQTEQQQPENLPMQQAAGAPGYQVQQSRNAAEFQKRVNIKQEAYGQLYGNKMMQSLAPSEVEANEEVARPIWLNGTLLLARRATVGGQRFIQGCWLDWEKIREQMCTDIKDLLPNARLQPGTPTSARSRMLATLPIELVPGAFPFDDSAWQSPLGLSLVVAWICVLLAALAVAILLRGVITLSERRGAFVSAVTHELRTPLTTFRMYTEMLADGMVTDEAQRKTYLETLQTEASRLAHLVENVLSYAKIERGRARGKVEDITVCEVVARVHERLDQRARQAEMNLVVELDDAAGQLVARCDVSAVEQILFNLVDNACKYATGGADNTLILDARPGKNCLDLRLRDHGPGISDRNRKKLFRPFSKSAKDAAHSAPGVGLGLALSRRLARDMGGNLELTTCGGPGACFVLTLPQK